VLASRLTAETVDSLHSNLARVFVALFFAALISATEVRSQEYKETLLSTDNAYNPVPNPDGKYIAYVRTGWGEQVFVSFGRSSLVSDVKIMNADGTATPRTLATHFFLSDWAPDSSSVVCYRDGKYALVSTEGKPTMEDRIPNDPNHFEIASEWVAFAPSLETIVWSRHDKSHRVIETPRLTIVNDGMHSRERVVPSPRGRYLAVFGEVPTTNLRVYDMRSHTWTDLGEVTISPDEDWFYLQPNWNPWFADGSRLVFLKNSKIVISSPDGTQQTEHNITGVAGLPVPSPDGESVAYVTYVPRPMKTRPDLQFWGGTTIWVVAASVGSTPRAVTEKSEDETYDLKWLNNSTVVFDRIADEAFYKNARIWKATVAH
jgi:Tol biopolymer transport system component